MEYIIHTDFNEKAICGEVNLPKGAVCQERNGFIYYNGKPLCVNRSENALRHFARNDDGNGLRRGELIQTIKSTLRDNEELWDRVCNDEVCVLYDRNTNGDTWLWSFEFYNADISTLEYILNLITI